MLSCPSRFDRGVEREELIFRAISSTTRILSEISFMAAAVALIASAQ